MIGSVIINLSLSLSLAAAASSSSCLGLGDRPGKGKEVFLRFIYLLFPIFFLVMRRRPREADCRREDVTGLGRAGWTGLWAMAHI